MGQIQIIIGGKELTFKVEIEHDTGHGTRWGEQPRITFGHLE